MWEWIFANKEWVFSGVGVALAAALIQLAKRYLKSKGSGSKSSSPASLSSFAAMKSSAESSNFELLPLSFEISLRQEIPQIAIWIYAVNHLGKELVFEALQVTHFNLSGGPSLENIHPVNEVRVPPRRTKQVLLRRPLVDSEMRTIEKTQRRNPCNANFSVIARASAGRRRLRIDSLSLSVNGWISGISSES